MVNEEEKYVSINSLFDYLEEFSKQNHENQLEEFRNVILDSKLPEEFKRRMQTKIQEYLDKL